MWLKSVHHRHRTDPTGITPFFRPSKAAMSAPQGEP
jgi:hypothetical protein